MPLPLQFVGKFEHDKARAAPPSARALVLPALLGAADGSRMTRAQSNEQRETVLHTSHCSHLTACWQHTDVTRFGQHDATQHMIIVSFQTALCNGNSGWGCHHHLMASCLMRGSP
jgi:hypothetical protein